MQPPAPALRVRVAEALPAAGARQQEQLARYVELVAAYSRVLNLTGFRGAEQLVEELVVEGARLFELGPLADGASAVDLGSGNGCPVVPLAVLCTEARFAAIEASQRRGAFLAIVRAELELDNLALHVQRVEEHISSGAGPYQLVTSRAFAKPGKLLALAAKLLAPRGEVRGYYGANIGEVEDAAHRAGLRLVNALPYTLGGTPRHVYALAWPREP